MFRALAQRSEDVSIERVVCVQVGYFIQESVPHPATSLPLAALGTSHFGSCHNSWIPSPNRCEYTSVSYSPCSIRIVSILTGFQLGFYRARRCYDPRWHLAFSSPSPLWLSLQLQASSRSLQSFLIYLHFILNIGHPSTQWPWLHLTL